MGEQLAGQEVVEAHSLSRPFPLDRAVSVHLSSDAWVVEAVDIPHLSLLRSHSLTFHFQFLFMLLLHQRSDDFGLGEIETRST
jgi:hypothetical protein